MRHAVVVSWKVDLEELDEPEEPDDDRESVEGFRRSLPNAADSSEGERGVASASEKRRKPPADKLPPRAA